MFSRLASNRSVQRVASTLNRWGMINKQGITYRGVATAGGLVGGIGVGLGSVFSSQGMPAPKFDYVKAETDYVRRHGDLPDAKTRLDWRKRAGPEHLAAYQRAVERINNR